MRRCKAGSTRATSPRKSRKAVRTGPPPQISILLGPGGHRGLQGDRSFRGQGRASDEGRVVWPRASPAAKDPVQAPSLGQGIPKAKCSIPAEMETAVQVMAAALRSSGGFDN